MRLRHVKHAKTTILEHPDHVVAHPEQQKGHWRNVFGNTHPIELEIGTGKGKFIYEMAQAKPDINFIGIEKFDSVIIRALEKALEKPLDNLKLIRIDAEKIPHLFGTEEISCIYLNFSDPWPKKRTAKRRLTSPVFLDRYQEVLKRGGVIRMKTDNFSLFQYSMMSFVQHPLYQIETIDLDMYRHLPDDNIQTEFEKKFVEMGHRIFYMKVRYIGSDI